MNEGSSRKKDEPAPELENQIILRLPPGPAEELRKALQSGAMNVKDRLQIHLEPDMRHCQVHFDNWVHSAKVVDLPSIIESLKSIDLKTFYKTADISQMIVCMTEEEALNHEALEDETKKKGDKKDQLKADKKYLFPHGITPPLKNVRKRRFRKTLKKKYADAPEIEKEVKRLLRVDNEAVDVKWEIITEEDEQRLKLANDTQGEEQRLFGYLSTSEEEGDDVNVVDSPDEDTRMSGSITIEDPEVMGNLSSGTTRSDFNMLLDSSGLAPEEGNDDDDNQLELEDQLQTALQNAGITGPSKEDDVIDGSSKRVHDLRKELADVENRIKAQESEIASIENHALKQRLQTSLNALYEDREQKLGQIKELQEEAGGY